MIRVGELFAGIGGIGLGLEMAGGFEVAWHVERDPYAQKVLAKHWPGVPLHNDVKTFPPDDSNKWQVDMITGGFPCQDISVAGKGAGLNGDRSGLFYEIIRIAGLLRPKWLLLENVPALLTRGFPDVLGALAQSGYDAQWRVLSAAEMGAPHFRKRIFIFAELADTDHRYERPKKTICAGGDAAIPCGETLADTNNTGCSEQRRPLTDETQYAATECSGWWSVEPALGRVANGVPHRVDRLRCLGNAVVPQCVAWLAHNWILPTAPPNT